MSDPIKQIDPRLFAVLGCATLGLGVGFFFFSYSIFAFLGWLMSGVGVGLLVAGVLSRRGKGD